MFTKNQSGLCCSGLKSSTMEDLCYEKIYQGKDTKASENGRKAENEANLEFLNNDGHFVPSARADSEPYM